MRARLQRIAESRDLSSVLEPEARREAEQLADNHGEGDLEARYLLGWFHWYRFCALPTGENQADLRTAVEAFALCFAAGIASVPEPLLPLLAEAAAPHAIQMLQHSEVEPDTRLLFATTDLWERIVRAAPADHPDRTRWLSLCGIALQMRFERTGALQDLDTSIEHLREAWAASAADHPDRVLILSNLGISLVRRFERTGALPDLGTAIDRLQQAVDTTPADHPALAAWLSNLGSALQTRFERTGALEDLEAGIEHLGKAVTAAAADYPGRTALLSNLGVALRTRFERTGVLQDLDSAIDRLQQAVEATPVDHPNHALWQSNLGGALVRRFERTGVLQDLDSAIDRLQQAVEATPADHPALAASLSNLGLALRTRFERTGVLQDLDSAIDRLQQAVEATPVDHPNHAIWLSGLGNALRVRFEGTGALQDLDTAIEHLREALAAIPADNPNRATTLGNLGSGLQRRFERTRALDDLAAAITVGQDAVAASPPDHTDRAVLLSALGGALLRNFELAGALNDLEAAIDRLRQAIAVVPTDHPNRAMWLSNLGVALRARFERTGALQDLDIAVDHLRQAVDATPADHPDLVLWLSNLGSALQLRFTRTRAVSDPDEAVACWLRASEVEAAAPSLRVRAGVMAAGLLAESGDAVRAAAAAEAAVRLLPQVAPRRLERGDQQYAVGSFAGLAATAAALALEAPGGTASERAERALGLLEVGRAVLLSQALETRSDLTDLREHHPELARQFTELRELLDGPVGSSGYTAGRETSDLGLDQGRLVGDRQRMAGQFTDLLAGIRGLDGFSSFALPPATDELLAQASHGPVVVFNVSDHRSDALLLTTEGITSLELPGLTPDKVLQQVTTFRRAQHLAISGNDQAGREKAQATLAQVLKWLWDTASGPVLKALGHHHRPGEEGKKVWPRVWWAPGGLLGLLPVHAAGYHTDPGGSPRTVMDQVVSSYTPTVRALRYARERALPPAGESPPVVRSLIVAMPTTPEQPDLHFVEAEAAMLQDRLPGPVLLREPSPASPSLSAPTKANVLERLAECAIAHFACHGASDPADPSNSRLLLHDHEDDPLTVASLAPVALDQAKLAYLSACRTAAIDTAELFDEAIHLTSAFQLAGFPHVIGTLWEIDDQIAVTIADLFYAGLQSDATELDPDRAAHALHHALRRVRDGHGLPAGFDRTRAPLLWAAHLHAGT
ncbi:hypothetical protein AS594_39740 [Streptomyces agglomeratus]|uniref:CHAT domain-containing protein n=2 Tax=Streptomyces agglomeratus TaxID=285458 RepID=A0A1E5NZP3_9ACTN|nr:hypothetical protein AS594_39740 [Streptomyces agglomeratus]